MFERILYPTDFGEYARPNLACVLHSLPACREAVLVHVVDVEKLQHNLLPGYMAEDEARIRAVAERTLEGWSKELKARGIEARWFLPTGVPSTEVLKIAQRERPDLIVVGKQSRSRVLERYLDATSEGVLKGAECPVLVTKYHVVAELGPEECERVCGHMFQRVLYATDWSAAAEDALRVVRGFRELGTETVLAVHVLDRGLLGHLSAQQAEEYARRDRERLDELARRLRFHGLDVETRFRVGKAPEEIEREAATRGIHLVVMGYVGRSGWRNAVWGSTTERVVRHTAQAVLVIKGEREDTEDLPWPS
jgi:nucleotide-binding universal stress UspA family protein